jgi:hypothetical protein
MDFQIGFNLAIALLGGLGGWVLKSIGEALKDLRAKDDALGKEVHQVHLLVADHYVKRDELDKHLSAIFDVLRRIEEKLDGEADKK